MKIGFIGLGVIWHSMARRRHGTHWLIMETTLIPYKRLIDANHGDEDGATLFRLQETLFNPS